VKESGAVLADTSEMS